MYNLINFNQKEKDKILKIVDFYNKVSENPILKEEVNKFIEDVVNLSISMERDLPGVLDLCCEFAYCYYKISDICDLVEASLLLHKSAGI